MGVHLDESELADLEPQIHKIFKKELGFFDNSTFTSTMATIHSGVEREGLEGHLKDELGESKKVLKLSEEVWAIVEEYYLLKQEQGGEGGGLGKRRHTGDQEDFVDVKRQRFVDPDDGRDRYDKAERYNQGELERVQRIPKKEEEGGDGEAKVKVEAPSAEKIREMMAATQKAIEDRKKKLKLVPVPPSQGAALGAKAQQLAALQASIASKLSQVLPPKLPDKPMSLIIDESGKTVDSQGRQIQLTGHIPTLRANQLALVKKLEKTVSKPEVEIKKPKVEKADLTFVDSRIAQKTAGRAKRSMVFHDAGKFQDEANRLRMKAQLEKLQYDISSIARKTGISSATQLAKLVPKGEKGEREEPDIEWWDQLLIGSTNYENWVPRPGAISNLIEHPIQLRPMESSRPVHVPMFLTKKEHKKLRRQNRRENWKERQDKIRLGLLAPDEPKVKMSNLMRVLGNEQIMDPTKVEAQVRAQMAKRKTDHETANQERKLTPAQKKEKSARKLKEDVTSGINVAVYRVKDLRNPAKKWKLEKNAQQLFMTGTVLLYQDVNIVVVEGGPKQQKKYKQLMLRRIKWNEDKYTDKDGTELENKAELVWEGQTKQRNFGDMKFKLCPTEGFAREHFKKAGCEHYWDHAYSTAVLANSDDA